MDLGVVGARAMAECFGPQQLFSREFERGSGAAAIELCEMKRHRIIRGRGAGLAQFTPQEQAGYALFRGKAQCNNCHRDGGPGEDPLFTDFTASNIGTPDNHSFYVNTIAALARQRSETPGWRGVEFRPIKLFLQAVKDFVTDVALRTQAVQRPALGGDRA